MTTQNPNGNASGTPGPGELLAAYADDGLSNAERQRVEDYLADNPQARRELDEIRSVITMVRDNPPEPAREPDWAAMSVGIAEAVTADAERPVGLGARVRAWLRLFLQPRYALGGLALTAAAVTLAVLATGWLERGAQVAEDPTHSPTGSPDGVRAPDGDPDPADMDLALDEALFQVAGIEPVDADDELDPDDEVVDALFEAIDPDAMDAELEAELAAFAGDTQGDAEVDTEVDDALDAVMAELLGEDKDKDKDEGEHGGPRDGWLDELSDQELDRLDTMLSEMVEA